MQDENIQPDMKKRGGGGVFCGNTTQVIFFYLYLPYLVLLNSNLSQPVAGYTFCPSTVLNMPWTFQNKVRQSQAPAYKSCKIHNETKTLLIMSLMKLNHRK